MKKAITIASAIVAAALLSACASTPTNSLAIQTENNQYEITGLGKTQIIAKNNAISAANKTCGNKASPILNNEQTNYNGILKGVVDEQTGQLIQAAADVLGNITGRNAGLTQDNDYQTTLTFRCQAN